MENLKQQIANYKTMTFDRYRRVKAELLSLSDKEQADYYFGTIEPLVDIEHERSMAYESKQEQKAYKDSVKFLYMIAEILWTGTERWLDSRIEKTTEQELEGMNNDVLIKYVELLKDGFGNNLSKTEKKYHIAYCENILEARGV